MKKLLILTTILFFLVPSYSQDTLRERADFYRIVRFGESNLFKSGYAITIGVDKKKNQPKTNRKGAGNDSTLFWFSETFDWKKIDTSKLGYFEIEETDSFFLGFNFYHPRKFTHESLATFQEDYHFTRLPGYGYLVYTITGFTSYTELYEFIVGNKELFFVGKENNPQDLYNVILFGQVLKQEPARWRPTV